MIAPRSAAAVAVWMVLVAGLAEADSLGGIAANEKSYVVGASRVCAPLAVTGGEARGAAACRTADTAEVAALSTRLPSPQRGAKAEVVATAAGRTIRVATAAGVPLVAWNSGDTVTSIVDVWRSPTDRLIVVEYVVRRAGRELHDVIGFDVGVGRTLGADPPPSTEPPPRVAPPPVADDPGLARVVTAARKARGKTAVKGWGIVLTLAPDHPEALYRLAALDVAGKRTAQALDRLEALARAPAPDAIEWLVEARFDKAFGKLVGEPRFRTAVGLDRAGTDPYERIMGLGGEWEQALVPCDQPEIKLTLRRDRKVTIVLRSACQGMRDKITFRGTWAITGAGIELRLPKLDTGDDAAPCLLARDRDEDVLRCQVDADLGFEARPSRR
ncbi:MAG: hypothetical protein IPL61_00235 [Myxococcales bacterium]|nr:hypothetical protein [Myxococcales bacterium]